MQRLYIQRMLLNAVRFVRFAKRWSAQ